MTCRLAVPTRLEFSPPRPEPDRSDGAAPRPNLTSWRCSSPRRRVRRSSSRRRVALGACVEFAAAGPSALPNSPSRASCRRLAAARLSDLAASESRLGRHVTTRDSADPRGPDFRDFYSVSAGRRPVSAASVSQAYHHLVFAFALRGCGGGCGHRGPGTRGIGITACRRGLVSLLALGPLRQPLRHRPALVAFALLALARRPGSHSALPAVATVAKICPHYRGAGRRDPRGRP